MKSIICNIGRYDIPVLQRQCDFEVDLLKSNIILIGSSQSGKSNLIRLIINILHKKMNVGDEEIFILDFDGALSVYRDMPLVSAYFDNSNEEYVKRVFKILENRMKENTSALNGIGFARNENAGIAHTTFFIDNFNAFLDEPRYSGYQEKLMRLCRDGISKGITVVVTASETKGTGRFMNNFPQKIAINLTDEKYSEIFGVKTGNIGKIAGRGFANVTEKPKEINKTFNINFPYEMHCSLAEDIKSPDFREKLEKKFKYSKESGFQKQVKKYQIFKSELTGKDFAELAGKNESDCYSAGDSKYEFIAGLDYVDFKPVILNFRQSRIMAVYSKREFGREELIERITERLMTAEPERKLVLFDDGRHQLESIKNKYENRYKVKYISCFEETTILERPSVSGRPTSNAYGLKAQLALQKSSDESVRQIKIKLSPMQVFYKYIHENCVSIGSLASKIYTGAEGTPESKLPAGCHEYTKDPTIFVIQSKLVYSAVLENKRFIENILPLFSDIAEERDYIFIFSDVKKMADTTVNEKFNALVRSVIVLDNIAEFVAERGQKTVLGDMEINMLKSDYAKCEKGDGYYYDVEADNLTKLKFIQEEEKNG